MTELNKPIKERRFHKAMLGLKEQNEKLVKRVHELIKENKELKEKKKKIPMFGPLPGLYEDPTFLKRLRGEE